MKRKELNTLPGRERAESREKEQQMVIAATAQGTRKGNEQGNGSVYSRCHYHLCSVVLVTGTRRLVLIKQYQLAVRRRTAHGA